MFRYVLVRASEHPSFAEGQAPAGLLSDDEAAALAGMEFLPRRRKWLLGRAAAKRLVGEIDGPGAAALRDINVRNRPSGEPYVVIAGQGEWSRPISISHRRELGLAALPEDAKQCIGADVETVEPRAAALVGQFFTAGEAGLVRAAGAGRDEMVARIWSAKEAVLKLLGLGLRLDTRTVMVGGDPPATDGLPAGWAAVAVSVADGPGVLVPRGLRVAWRLEARHVLTIAVGR